MCDYFDNLARQQDMEMSLAETVYLYDISDMPDMPNEYSGFGEMMYDNKKLEEKCKQNVEFSDVMELLSVIPDGNDKSMIKLELSKMMVEIADEYGWIDVLDELIQSRMRYKNA